MVLKDIFHSVITPCSQELVPPQYESSDEVSSDDDSVKIGLGIGEWAFDVPQTAAEESDPDMSDLWVVEDRALVTEGRRRKYSLQRYNTCANVL